MSIKRILISISMVMRMLVRRRIILILLGVIPLVFLSIVELTTSDRILPFRLASLDEEVFINISEKGISFVFFAVSCAGFLVSFIALNLIQRNSAVNRRLIICGYKPQELLISVLFSLLMIILLIAGYIGLLTNIFYEIDHLLSFIVSLALIGFVYGCYGLTIGSLVNRELEGILLIVLLVNIDVGWLQNPLFYADAQNQLIIEMLPAYYPSQAGIISAFTNYSSALALGKSILYGATFLIVSMALFHHKMRLFK